MKLKIKGNKELYQMNRKIELVEISLEGIFEYNSDNKILFTVNDKNVQFETINDLQSFSENIRGKSKEAIILSFMQKKQNENFAKYLFESNSTTVDLIKSLFLIYYWIELPLLNMRDFNIRSNIFNEFVVDWTFRPESQKDIYFIKDIYINDGNKIYLDKLIELNLLAQFEISHFGDENYITYFTTLNRPGVSKDLFKIDSLNDDKAYVLWKNILFDRDKRMSNWVNNRY